VARKAFGRDVAVKRSRLAGVQSGGSEHRLIDSRRSPGAAAGGGEAEERKSCVSRPETEHGDSPEERAVLLPHPFPPIKLVPARNPS
jgi:hypothetical protein